MSSVVSTVSTSSNPTVLAQEQPEQQAKSDLTVATTVIAVPGVLFLLAVLMALLITAYGVYKRRKLSKTGIGDPEYGLVEDGKGDHWPLRTDEHHDRSGQENKPSNENEQLLVPGGTQQIDTSVSCPKPPKGSYIHPSSSNLQIEQLDLSQIKSSPGVFGTDNETTKPADVTNEAPSDEIVDSVPTPILTRRHRTAIVGPIRIRRKVKFEIRFKKYGEPFFYKRSARVAPFDMVDVFPQARQGGRKHMSKNNYSQPNESTAVHMQPIPLIVTLESWTRDSHLTQIPLWRDQSKDYSKIPTLSGIKCKRGPPKFRRRKRSTLVPEEVEKISMQDPERRDTLTFGHFEYNYSNLMKKSSSMITHAPSITNTAAYWQNRKSLSTKEEYGPQDDLMMTWSEALNDSNESFQLYPEHLGKNASSYIGTGAVPSHLPDIDAGQGAMAQLPGIGAHQDHAALDKEGKKGLPSMYFSGLSVSTDEGDEETYKLRFSDTTSTVASSKVDQVRMREGVAAEQPTHIKVSTSQGKIEDTSFIVPQDSKIVISTTAPRSQTSAMKIDGQLTGEPDLLKRGKADAMGVSDAEVAISPVSMGPSKRPSAVDAVATPVGAVSPQPPGGTLPAGHAATSTAIDPDVGPLNITRISSLVKQLISSTDSESGKDTLEASEKKKWHSGKRQVQSRYDKVGDDVSEELNSKAEEEMKKGKGDANSSFSYVKGPKNIQGWGVAGQDSLQDKNKDNNSDYNIEGISKTSLGIGKQSELTLTEHSKDSNRSKWEKGSRLTSKIMSKLHRRKTGSTTSREDISSTAADEMMQAKVHEKDASNNDIVDIQSLGTSVEDKNTSTEIVSADAGSGTTIQPQPDSQRRSRKVRISSFNEDSDTAFPSVSTYFVNKDQARPDLFSTEGDRQSPGEVKSMLKEQRIKETDGDRAGKGTSDMLVDDMVASQRQKRVRIADNVEDSDKALSSVESQVNNKVAIVRGHGGLFSSQMGPTTPGARQEIPTLDSQFENRQRASHSGNTDRQTPDNPTLTSEYTMKQKFPKGNLTEESQRHEKPMPDRSIIPLRSKSRHSNASVPSLVSSISTFRERVLSSNTGRTSRTSSFIKSARLRKIGSGTDIGSTYGANKSSRHSLQSEIGHATSDIRSHGSIFGDGHISSIWDRGSAGATRRRAHSIGVAPEERDSDASSWKRHREDSCDEYGAKLVKEISTSPLMVVEDAQKYDTLHKRDSELFQDESDGFFSDKL